MERECRRLGLAKPIKPNEFKDHYLVDDKNKVIYCYLFKVASSTFKTIISSAASRTPIEEITEKAPVNSPIFLHSHGVKYINEYSEEEISHRINNYFKFVVVRHPFDRLLSAWRYKMEYALNKSHTGLDKLTADQQERWTSFLRNVSDNRFRNPHWTQYVSWCNLCQIHYDSILRLETIGRDLPLILEKLPGPDGHPNESPIRKAMSPIPPNDKLSRLTDYFKYVDKSVVDGLLRLYKVDFDILGYHWDINSAKASCNFDMSDEKDGKSVCC